MEFNKFKFNKLYGKFVYVLCLTANMSLGLLQL